MRKVPHDPEGWLREIAEAYEDAWEALPFMELVGEEAEEMDLWKIAPLVALKFRQLPSSEENCEKATNAAFASYVANKERNPAELGDAYVAFAFSYLASHFGLDLVTEPVVDEVMEHVGRHRERR